MSRGAGAHLPPRPRAAAGGGSGGGDVAVDRAFAALADPTRRAVVQLLVHESLRAGELAARVGTSAPALSRHLRLLKAAGVVVDEGVDGDARVRLYRLAPQALDPLRDWLDGVEQAWGEQLAAFRAYAEGAAPAAARDAAHGAASATRWPAVPAHAAVDAGAAPATAPQRRGRRRGVR